MAIHTIQLPASAFTSINNNNTQQATWQFTAASAVNTIPAAFMVGSLPGVLWRLRLTAGIFRSMNIDTGLSVNTASRLDFIPTMEQNGGLLLRYGNIRYTFLFRNLDRASGYAFTSGQITRTDIFDSIVGALVDTNNVDKSATLILSDDGDFGSEEVEDGSFLYIGSSKRSVYLGSTKRSVYVGGTKVG